ncbi:MAG: hypothetical protein ACJ8C4_05470 [Gemmataceae bacterium]
MTDSLRTFFAGLIDYAGLFPPAALQLDPAIRNYARYRKEPDAWMLGRFIISAARLNELDPYVDELFAAAPPLTIAALGRGGADESHFLSALELDLQEIDRLHDRHGRRVAVEVYEAKLPAQFGSSFLAEVCKFIDAYGEPALTPYFEAAPGPQWSEAMAAIAYDRTMFKRKRCGPPGGKLRTGGVEASAFPSTEQVATCIHAAVAAGVPIKCTAGLHHPVRLFHDSVKTKMHGFLDVFGAGILAAAHKLDVARIRDILDEEQSSNFRFDADGFHWRDLRATPLQVAEAREEAIVSFGSCSFDEPREDLRALGMM